MFKAGYIAENSGSSWDHREHDEKNMSYGKSFTTKGKQDLFHPIISFRQRGQVCKFTYLLLYDYHGTHISMNFEYNQEF